MRTRIVWWAWTLAALAVGAALGWLLGISIVAIGLAMRWP